MHMCLRSSQHDVFCEMCVMCSVLCVLDIKRERNGRILLALNVSQEYYKWFDLILETYIAGFGLVRWS